MKNYFSIVRFLLMVIPFVLLSCNDENDDIVKNPINGLVANAGDDQTIPTNTDIELNGSKSFDKNGKPFSYEWSIKTKPASSLAILSSPTSVIAEFKPDVAGLYILRLTLKQDQFTSIDDVVIRVTSTTDPGEPITIVISEDINEKTTLPDIFDDPTKPDYIVTGDIDVRDDLTIKPGVTIIFEEHASLNILSGKFLSQGTVDKPITFRGVEERTGYWKGILIHPNDLESALSYSIVRHAGSQAFPEAGVKAAVVLAGTSISGAALRISNSTLELSGGHALFLQGRSSLGTLDHNTFSNNLGAIYIPASQLGTIGAGNTFVGNNFNGVETSGDVDFEDVTWRDLSPASYFLTTDVIITKGVTVEPGAAFQMAGNTAIKIKDHGYLNATGTAEKKIRFTAASTTHNWAGLYFNTQSPNNKLIHTEISYGGSRVLEDVAEAANIGVGNGGHLHVENTLITNGPGYGLIAKYYYQVNENIVSVNQFTNLLKGKILPRDLNFPDRPALAGDWMDMWSHTNNIRTVALNFFNPSNGVWFGGAVSPWTQSSGGMGIHFTEDGKFVWAIGEHSPMTECTSYSAEYITGTFTVTEQTIVLHQDYWRDKYVNDCDPAQNVDMEITPSDISLRYEYDKLYNLFTGEVIWQLKFINPDGSAFSFYRH